MADHPPVSDDVLARLRAACVHLPEITEEPAWVGTRWRVRAKTFAHVLMVADGWPPAYAEAVAHDDTVCVLTFRAQGEELEVLRDAPPPFFKPVWFDDIVGLVLGDSTEWEEVQELLTESYCALAPQKLVARVDRPGV